MAPYETMLKSKSYERLRGEHPAELAPANVFFTHDARSAIDRRNSFRVKAALVYWAITGHHDDHVLRANRLLLALANACHSAIHAPKDAGNGDTKDANKKTDKDKTEGQGAGEAGDGNQKADADQKAAEVTDEAWDEEHKRVVDGIFLVVGFLTKLKVAIGKSTDRDGVDESFQSQHMHDIVTDVIKLENQLPLRDLLAVAGVVEAAINKTLGTEEFKDVKPATTGAGGEYRLGFTRDSFGDVVHDFCWYYSPFALKKAPAPADGPFKRVATDGDLEERTLLDCLHQSVAPKPGAGAHVAGGPSRMLPARELRRAGVRIQPSDTGRAVVAFSEQSATLRMPVLAYDFKLATVARNLLAREYEEQSKPVTRYFQMMNEVVEDVADVKVLLRFGVVRGGSAAGVGPPEVHELIKKIDGHATYPSVYMATDREIQKVKLYHDQRMKSFFVRNRPVVIWASSVAAISVVAIVAARKARGSS